MLHEKPFAGVNGSGKHNNWSISTDEGVNLLEPGKTPHENAQFLLFLVAIIKAIDEYQDLVRVSAASAGNDHRLGANEAPPAIVSMFLGDELTEILDAIEAGADYKGRKNMLMEIGATVLPHFPKDTTDRNRTSPFAFTGNKFEFRMLGAASSIAGPNIILNTAVAESLRQFADLLENADDFTHDLTCLIKNTYSKHRRIVFNGNNYSEEWVEEAAQRGLSNLHSAVDALPEFASNESVELFKRHAVFTKTELNSRLEILFENYCKTIHIEALTMVSMVKTGVIPAVIDFQNNIAELVIKKDSICGALKFDSSLECYSLSKISKLSADLLNGLSELEDAVLIADDGMADILDLAVFYRNTVISAMNKLRCTVDGLELLVARKNWPVPTYADILFSVI